MKAGKEKCADYCNQPKKQAPPATNVYCQRRVLVGKRVHWAVQYPVLVVVNKVAGIGKEPVGVVLQVVGQVVGIYPEGGSGHNGVVKGWLGAFLIPQLIGDGQRQTVAIGHMFNVGVVQGFIGVFKNGGENGVTQAKDNKEKAK